jgi:hypothetical protein
MSSLTEGRREQLESNNHKNPATGKEGEAGQIITSTALKKEMVIHL